MRRISHQKRHTQDPSLRFPTTLQQKLQEVRLTSTQANEGALQRFTLLPFRQRQLNYRALHRHRSILRNRHRNFSRHHKQHKQGVHPITIHKHVRKHISDPTIRHLLQLKHISHLIRTNQRNKHRIKHSRNTTSFSLPSHQALRQLQTIRSTSSRHLRLIHHKLLPQSKFSLRRTTTPTQKTTSPQRKPINLHLPRAQQASKSQFPTRRKRLRTKQRHARRFSNTPRRLPHSQRLQTSTQRRPTKQPTQERIRAQRVQPSSFKLRSSTTQRSSKT